MAASTLPTPDTSAGKACMASKTSRNSVPVASRANARPIARAVVANTGAPQPSTPIGFDGAGDISDESR